MMRTISSLKHLWVTSYAGVASMGLIAGVVMLALYGCALGEDGGGTPRAPSGFAAEGPLANLAAAAAREGKMHWYTSIDPDTAQKVADAFGATYGVHVEFTRLVAGPLTARYAAEAEAGATVADVILTSDYLFFDNAVANGWIVQVAEANLPTLHDVPDRFIRGTSVITGFSLYGILVNTDNVAESDIPKKWPDLLDPRWQDNIYTHDPRSVNVALAYWQALADKYGEQFVRDVAAQGLEFVDSMVSASQLVAAGERDLAVGVSTGHISPLLAEAPDAPVTHRMLSGLTFGGEWNAGISAEAPHPNAARLFVSWLLTPEGQRVLNQNIGPSVLPNVVIPGHEPLGPDFVPLDLERATTNRATLLSLLGISG